MPTEQKAANRNRPRFRFMRMDWYVLTEVIGPFFGGLIFFEFLFLMFQALRLAEFFIVHGVAAATLGKMTLFLGLSFLPTALPIAFLIAVLTAFGRFSADSELVAMKANGFSLARLSVPLVLLSIAVSGFSVALNTEWVPWGETAFKRTLIKVGNTKVVSSIKEGTFTSGFFDLLIFADKIDTKTNRMKKVFIYDEREPKNPLAVVAAFGEVLPVKTSTELGAAALLKLHNGSIHSNDIQSNTYQKIGFGEYKLYLKIDEGSTDNTTKPRMFNYQQLQKMIQNTKAGTFENLEFRAEFWRRYATALSPVIFIFLGMGFGTVRTRAVRAGSALLALIILIIYWVVQAWATVQMQRGWFSPFFAMQIPNLIMLLGAVAGFRRATW
ncbi:MAG: hypothetical protein A2070_02670 [Bdellovibrionales bacterium GWC1_52_8]|nr:MAG: hypothetical protein A2Z97_13200 [Bdellovibrionales bacterium GWB1_52_6]OFZ05789.1 MAG: hypothetical protein A2X97_03750 [Bdellovibrionales bacterium GWA1_52_35]OFZ43683.1 MAG: hypothetical protein A2070_02670 [Bdellovibrionales bacterium GWC1_52_8]HCM40270.1 hypothetical protein [Bdellovibrionales bacterium]